jgi:hypothetical protein
MTLREECRLRVFENRVFRGTIGPKRIEVTGSGESCTEFWWGNQRGRDHWGDTGVNVRIISRWIFSGMWEHGLD